jgi:hypothetical protein
MPSGNNEYTNSTINIPDSMSLRDMIIIMIYRVNGTGKCAFISALVTLSLFLCNREHNRT